MRVFSPRISTVSESQTLALNARAKKMRAEGIDVVNLTAGEPDFPMPENVKAAAVRAVESDFTHYTCASGTPELRQAIKEKLSSENGLHYSEEQIIVSSGAKHSIFNAVVALCSEECEVLIPAPYWVSYYDIVCMSGARPAVLPTENFKLSAEALEKAINPWTSCLILNSPNNPTGAVYSKKELKEIGRVIEEKKIFALSDECYEKMVYGGEKHHSIGSFSEALKELTVTVNSFSKTYSMTGLRIGYLACQKQLASLIARMQSHSTSNPCSVSQMAALEALKGPQEPVRKMVKEFEKRRNFTVKRLNGIRGIECSKPQGAFYAFPDISALERDSLKFCEKLLDDEKLVIVPGKVFGAEGFARISYAASMDCIAEGMDRLERFAKKFCQ